MIEKETQADKTPKANKADKAKADKAKPKADETRQGQAPYDIFISYRRAGGAQYARILQLMLNQRGYRTFLDYDELVDGIFNEHIRAAITEAPVFLLVLSPDALVRCANEDDWVRQEISLAIRLKKHMIPVNPDNLYNGIPDNLPAEIRTAVLDYQHSDVQFGQTLGITIDFLIEKRIAPVIGSRPVGRNEDFPDGENGGTRNKKRFQRLVLAAFVLCGAFLAVLAVAYTLEKKHFEKCDRYHEVKHFLARRRWPGFFRAKADALLARYDSLRIETTPDGSYLNWSDELTLNQLQTLNRLLAQMTEVEGGTFWMGASEVTEDVDPALETPPIEQSVKTFLIGRYEVSVEEWGEVMQQAYDPAQASMPQANIRLDECRAFTEKLSQMTGLVFRLPTEAEWEYAARGGRKADSTKYAGRNQAGEAAWYKKNSRGRAHGRNDRQGGLYCNGLDLFDMSGNVSEWCDTPFRLYSDLKANAPRPEIIDPDAWVVRGGNYDSDEYELTVTHRDPMNKNEKAPTVGFRLARDK